MAVIAIAGATGALGRSVVELARAQGHEVREISRSRGVDVLSGEGLAAALDGADTLIECLKPAGLDDTAADWFERAARSLGDHARAAGITRTVVVSIVGIDAMQDYPYYRSQLAHEQAILTHCPGAVVVRATQFHDFVSQQLRDVGDHLEVMDAPSQPVDTREVAALLLAQALAADPAPLVEIAGPRPERTLDLAHRLLAARGDTREVIGLPPSPSMAAGGMLPGPEARLAGPTFDEWLAERER